MRSAFILACSILFFYGCNSDSAKETTTSGIEITYIKKGNLKPEYGNLLLINTRYETQEGSILLQSKPEDPMPVLYNDQTKSEAGLLKEVLDNLKIGDSVYFEIPTKDLFEVTFNVAVPDSLDPNDNLKFYMGLESQMTENEYRAYVVAKELELAEPNFQKEESELDQYIRELGKQTEKMDVGIYYTVLEKGSDVKIENGDYIDVRYKGMLLNGKEFDSGVYSFNVGNEEVIKGWDYAFKEFSEGTRATLYIPSRFAYGSRGSGRAIPPFSTLVFDVEVLEVKK